MRRKIIALWGNEYIQGGFLLTISAFLMNFINYLFHFFAARILGPSDYGEIVAFFSYVSIFSVPMAVFSTIIIQKISSHESNKYIYASSIYYHFRRLFIRFLPLILLLFVLTPLMPIITNLTQWTAYIIIPMIIVGIVGTFYLSLIQGLKLFMFFSVLNIANTIVKLVSIVFPAFKLGGVSSIVSFIFVMNIVSLIVVMYIFFKKKIIHTPSFSKFKPLTTFRHFLLSYQFLLTLVAILSISILSNIDIIIAKKYLSSVDAGIYGSWSIFAKIILYIVGPVIQMSFVYFSDSQQKQFRDKIFLISLGLLGLFGLISFIGYTYFGNILVAFLFGDKFILVSSYLGYAAIFGTFYTAINFFNTYFIAKKSVFSFLLAIVLPIYILSLLLIQKQLLSFMIVNIIFSASASFLYIIAFFHQKKSHL